MLKRFDATFSVHKVRAKALGDEDALSSAIDFLLNNFHDCMQPPQPSVEVSPTASGCSLEETEGMYHVPACLEDDTSPAVDVLLAMAER